MDIQIIVFGTETIIIQCVIQQPTEGHRETKVCGNFSWTMAGVLGSLAGHHVQSVEKKKTLLIVFPTVAPAREEKISRVTSDLTGNAWVSYNATADAVFH